MPFIQLNNQFPGIEGLLLNKPATGKAICGFVHQALRGKSSLSTAEREMIAAYTSYLNHCEYCQNIHTEIASALLKDNGDAMSCVIGNIGEASLSSKMKSLLQLAAKVQQGGMNVTEQDINNARIHGASDRDLHDTVMVAAMFCFINRYVDGLRTDRFVDKEDYQQPAKQLARFGYHYPNFIAKFFMKKMLKKLNVIKAIASQE